MARGRGNVNVGHAHQTLSHKRRLCFHGRKDPSNALCMLSGLLKRTKWNLIIAVPLLPLALAERLISTAFLLFTEVTKRQLYIPDAPNLWNDSNLRNLCVPARHMYHLSVVVLHSSFLLVFFRNDVSLLGIPVLVCVHRRILKENRDSARILRCRCFRWRCKCGMSLVLIF